MLLTETERASVLIIKNDCLLYYIEKSRQIFKRISFNDIILKKLEIIDPRNLESSLTDLIKSFPNLLEGIDVEELDGEWKLLLNLDRSFY